MLSVHYRHPVNFAQELVESAANGLERIQTSYNNLKHRLTISADLVVKIPNYGLNKIKESN